MTDELIVGSGPPTKVRSYFFAFAAGFFSAAFAAGFFAAVSAFLGAAAFLAGAFLGAAAFLAADLATVFFALAELTLPFAAGLAVFVSVFLVGIYIVEGILESLLKFFSMFIEFQAVNTYWSLSKKTFYFLRFLSGYFFTSQIIIQKSYKFKKMAEK